MSDPFDLARFVTAQDPVLDTVREELGAGRKRSHWMWFIFPQLRALGHSPTAQFYGITSGDEVRAYLGHPLLGLRLLDCTQLAVDASAPSLNAFFGSPDDLKFRSSMTLFAMVSDDPLFRRALDRWCGGDMDARTVELIG